MALVIEDIVGAAGEVEVVFIAVALSYLDSIE